MPYVGVGRVEVNSDLKSRCVGGRLVLGVDAGIPSVQVRRGVSRYIGPKRK